MDRRINGDQAFFGLRLPSGGTCYRAEAKGLYVTPLAKSLKHKALCGEPAFSYK